MDDGVDSVLGQDPRDDRLPDIRADEFRPAQLMRGRHRVHGDDPVHIGIALNAPYETASELTGRSCHEHDLAQDQRLPLKVSVGATVSGRYRAMVTVRRATPFL